MYAEDAIATGAIASFVAVGELIIEEVGVETSQLVFVLEIDLIRPADQG